MIDMDALHKKRKELMSYFVEQSIKTGRPAILSTISESDYALYGRLFEYKFDNRWFILDATDDRDYITGFTKKAGLNFEIDLLNLFCPISYDSSFEPIWGLYVDWIHNKIDPEVAQRKVDDLQVK